ncbi:MAG: hypothetical protein E7264_00765 [Lachnospiraceae bacterium]|nr:hypothetical protein [Lachnospiraceae bacterium]
MYKVRFDIVLFTIIWVFLVVLVNFFLPPYERTIYEEMDTPSTYEGYPVNEYVDVVTTWSEIETAIENYDTFSIQVDTDKIQPTNYFGDMTSSGVSFSKSNAFLVHAQGVIGKSYSDRLYVVELADGNRVVVQMYPRVLDLSAERITLPIAEYKSLSKSMETLEAIDEKYDLTTTDATSSIINATGSHFCNEEVVREKRDFIYIMNMAIIAAGFVLYTIISTILMVVARKKVNSTMITK